MGHPVLVYISPNFDIIIPLGEFMLCPQCGYQAADGMKFCPIDGTPLSQEGIESLVGRLIETKYKDQKLLDIETSALIADRLQGWAKLFAAAVALPVALLLIVLSILGFSTWKDVTTKLDAAKQSAQTANDQVGSARKSADELVRSVAPLRKSVEDAHTMIDSARPALETAKALGSQIDKVRGDLVEQQKRLDMQGTALKTNTDVIAQQVDDTNKRLASTVTIASLQPTTGTPAENELFNQVRTNELSLARAARVYFDEKNYKAAVRFYSEARKVETSKVWQSDYPFFAGSYFFLGDEADYKSTLEEMMSHVGSAQEGYLGHKTTLGFLVQNLGTLRSQLPPTQWPLIDKYINLVEAQATRVQ